MEELSSKEAVVLGELVQNASLSQRTLSRNTGISLGLINAILKKLAHTGYIKVANLNKKTLNYLVTPEGFTVQANRTYHFVISTIRRYQSIRDKIYDKMSSLVSEGHTDFVFLGDDELKGIVAVVCRENFPQIYLRNEIESSHANTVFLALGNQDVPKDYPGKVAHFLSEVRS